MGEKAWVGVDVGKGFHWAHVVDASGYARIKHRRVYVEEGLASCEVALWLGDDGLVVEHGGRTLSRCDVSLSRGAAKLEDVTNPRLFTTGYGRGLPQLRLFGLEEALGKGGWPKMLRLRGYAPRGRRLPEALQQALFPYLEAP